MRLSTVMIHSNSVNAMLKRQTDVARTQNEIASGLRVQKPSDDPVAAVKIMQLEQTRSANTQYGTNIAAVTSRLQLEEQALADTENLLQRVRELAVQGNSSALSPLDRQSIAAELSQLNKQLLDTANRKDANGEYLFAGLSSSIQPFLRNASNAMSYVGDAGARLVQTDSAQYVQDGDSGYSVFMAVRQGNGTFVTGAGATNTGTGIISGSVQAIASWVPDDYTLTFTSPTSWQVTNSASTVVTSGTNYVAGTAIAFNGVQVSVAGAPASGDTFTVSRSRSEDIFTTLDSLLTSLSSGQGSDASKAAFQNQMNKTLQQLDQAEAHVLNIRTSVGARNSMLTNVESTRADAATQLDSALSTLRESDYAEAVSRFSRQTLGLQAAQQSYAKIAQLSLFNYL